LQLQSSLRDATRERDDALTSLLDAARARDAAIASHEAELAAVRAQAQRGVDESRAQINSEQRARSSLERSSSASAQQLSARAEVCGLREMCAQFSCVAACRT
jgi:hypothetical protein